MATKEEWGLSLISEHFSLYHRKINRPNETDERAHNLSKEVINGSCTA